MLAVNTHNNHNTLQNTAAPHYMFNNNNNIHLSNTHIPQYRSARRTLTIPAQFNNNNNVHFTPSFHTSSPKMMDQRTLTDNVLPSSNTRSTPLKLPSSPKNVSPPPLPQIARSNSTDTLVPENENRVYTTTGKQRQPSFLKKIVMSIFKKKRSSNNNSKTVCINNNNNKNGDFGLQQKQQQRSIDKTTIPIINDNGIKTRTHTIPKSILPDRPKASSDLITQNHFYKHPLIFPNLYSTATCKLSQCNRPLLHLALLKSAISRSNSV